MSRWTDPPIPTLKQYAEARRRLHAKSSDLPMTAMRETYRDHFYRRAWLDEVKTALAAGKQLRAPVTRELSADELAYVRGERDQLPAAATARPPGHWVETIKTGGML